MTELVTMPLPEEIVFADPLPGHAPVRLRDFVVPLATIAALVLLSLTLAVHFAVRAFDGASVVREQTLARNGIDQRLHEVEQMIVPQTDWDDAVRHLDNRFDGAWAHDNVGTFLHQADGFDAAYVLDARDAAVYASVEGGALTPDRYGAVAGIAQPLVAQVRGAEVRRGPLRRTAARAMISRPIQASRLHLLDGQLAIVTATLVQPDFGTALPAGSRAPVVVTRMAMDQDFLDLLARRFLLKGLHARLLDQPQRAGEAEILLRDEDGAPLAALAWTPLDPGYSMLRRMVLPVTLSMLGLMAIAWWQLRRIRKLAQHLIAEEAQLRAMLLGWE